MKIDADRLAREVADMVSRRVGDFACQHPVSIEMERLLLILGSELAADTVGIVNRTITKARTAQ